MVISRESIILVLRRVLDIDILLTSSDFFYMSVSIDEVSNGVSNSRYGKDPSKIVRRNHNMLPE